MGRQLNNANIEQNSNDAADNRKSPSGLSAFPFVNQIVRLIIYRTAFLDSLSVTAQRSFGGHVIVKKARRAHVLRCSVG